jgi:SAM-dependent methyltransferase
MDLKADLSLEASQSLSRYEMYNGIRQAVPSDFKERKEQRILAISHSVGLCNLTGLVGKIEELNWPEGNILKIPAHDDVYDVVVSDQVLEHVEGSPLRAVDESIRVLKPGGLLLHTTCFLNPVHRDPVDLWRFTPDALRFMAQEKVDIISAEGWGNPLAIMAIILGRRRMRIPQRWGFRRFVATWNHPRYPIVTWVIGVKRHAN